jgi:predicted acetyltransferase
MSTRATYRGQGCATAILDELLRWFANNETDIVDLNTTADGRGIYERVGFTAPAYDVLRWHQPVEGAAD